MVDVETECHENIEKHPRLCPHEWLIEHCESILKTSLIRMVDSP